MAALAQDQDEVNASEDGSGSEYSSVSNDPEPQIQAYGHAYHGSGRIYIPNDAAEDARLNMQHELWKLCLDGRLHDAKLPIEVEGKKAGNRRYDDDEEEEGADTSSSDEYDTDDIPFRILDVGSGNGVWAVEAARRYPMAKVLGVDISSALLPEDVPLNLTFEIADVEEPWPSRLYDYIHMRDLAGGGIRNWEQFLQNALDHLKPGGTLEFSGIRPKFCEVDAAHADLPAGETPFIGTASSEYKRIFNEHCEKQNISFDPIPRVLEWCKQAGMEGVRERVDWLPVRIWGNDPIMRRKGEMIIKLVDSGLENFTMMLFGKGGWDEADTRELLGRVCKETRDPELRSYFNLTFITARKPMDSEDASEDEEDEDEHGEEEDDDREKGGPTSLSSSYTSSLQEKHL